MRILNFEDDVFKHNDILKVVESTGRHEVVWVRSAEEGLEEVHRALEQGRPYDLIITDMHFPLSPGGEDSIRAGKTVMEELERAGVGTPIIVCSSMNIRPAGAYGSVWYSDISDWDLELAELVRGLGRKHP